MKKEEILKIIKPVAPKHCDLCGEKYAEQDFQVANQDRGETTVSISCKNCQNTYMLNVFSPAMGVLGSSRSKLNLDLKGAEEISRFAKMPAISADEALDAYNMFTSAESQVLSKVMNGLSKRQIKK
ncbi:MAG: hypothetical protein ACOCXP_01380 [Candidatus Dojkabacteria bacterium]